MNVLWRVVTAMFIMRRLCVWSVAQGLVAKRDRDAGWKGPILVLMTASAILSGGCRGKEVEPEAVVRPVRAIQVSEPKLLGGRWFPGCAEPTAEVNLSFRVGGPLIERPIEVGDEVKAGHVLAQIDPQDYSVRLQNVQAQLGTATSGLELAEKEYDRVTRIQEQDAGAISQAAVDRAIGARDRSSEEVNSLKAAVQEAEDQLSYAKLAAPFDGTIVGIYVENFQDVQPKQPVVRLINAAKIEMWVDIPEQLISRAPFINSLRVRFDAFPDRELTATIKELGQEANQATGTYPVNLIMDQPSDFTILPGMAGETQANMELPEDYAGDAQGGIGLEVPLAAVFSGKEPQQSYVWVVTEADNTIHRREVQTGRVSEYGILIREGLQAGEWVVIAGVDFLEEGQQVKLPEVSATSGSQDNIPDNETT